MLLREGYQVRHLGRTLKMGPIPSFLWNISSSHIEKDTFNGVDAIIHLAGAGIADQPWTPKRKQQILQSRTNSTALLCDKLKTTKNSVKTFIASSAIGYYGFERDQIFKEDHEPGTDFLADVVKRWEAEVDKIQTLSIRTVKIRTGIVLSAEGGALPEIAKPVRYWVGAPLGTGQQCMSWIHIEDLCRMFLYALVNEQLRGAYNGVGPTWTTNSELTKSVARILKKPLWLPRIPPFVLKMMLGEMANLVLFGSKVSSEKIQHVGFEFRFPSLEGALTNLFQRP